MPPLSQRTGSNQEIHSREKPPHLPNVLQQTEPLGRKSDRSELPLQLHSFAFHHTPNVKTLQLAADTFDNLTKLTFLSLDNSCAGVIELQPGVFKNLRKLSKLSARNMVIQSFSKEVFGNLTELQILLLNQNVMQSLDVNVLEALPKLRYLDLRNIPLSYTCLNSDLQNWTLS